MSAQRGDLAPDAANVVARVGLYITLVSAFALECGYRRSQTAGMDSLRNTSPYLRRCPPASPWGA